MKITYEFSTMAQCPVDGEHITINVTLTTEDMIEVEDLLDFCREITAGPIMQEPFTEKLAARFHNDGIVTIGTHSGVRITCSI